MVTRGDIHKQFVRIGRLISIHACDIKTSVWEPRKRTGHYINTTEILWTGRYVILMCVDWHTHTVNTLMYRWIYTCNNYVLMCVCTYVCIKCLLSFLISLSTMVILFMYVMYKKSLPTDGTVTAGSIILHHDSLPSFPLPPVWLSCNM